MIPNLRSSTLLDRQSHRRADADYLTALRTRADTRYLALVEARPVIVSHEERTTARLRWTTGSASSGSP